MDWLGARRPVAPAPLDRAMARAVAASVAPADAVPDALAAAGLAALRRVLAEPSSRATALELLTADALLTHACEAAAEAGDGALDRLRAGLAPARLAELLSEAS